MKTVYKYSATLGGTTRIQTPEYFYPLHFAVQGGMLRLWALVDIVDDSIMVARSIRVVGTGYELPDYIGKEHYIGTAQLPGGLVIHAFWETKIKD